MTHTPANMNITYEPGDFEQHYHDLLIAYKHYWEERGLSGRYKMQYKPDFSYLWALWQSNMLIAIVGKNDNNEIVSAWVASVMPHWYNPTHLHSQDLMYFIREDYRSAKSLKQMFGEIDKTLKDKGVHISTISVPAESRSSGAIRRYGYKHIDSLYSKVLD